MRFSVPRALLSFIALALWGPVLAAQSASEADRGPGLTIAGGVQAAVYGSSGGTYGPDTVNEDQGLGAVVVLTQGVSRYVVIRARLGTYAADVPAFTSFGERESPDTFSLLSVGGGVMFQARLGGPFSLKLGPQVSIGRYRYEYGPELQAALGENDAVQVVRDHGVRWAADVAVEVTAQAPFGVGLVSGIDVPVGREWGDEVEVDLQGLADPCSRRYRVPIPRLHLGVSVRIR